MASRIGRKPRKHVPRAEPRGVPQPAFRRPNDAPSAPKETEREIQRLHRYVRQKLTEIEQVYQYSPVGLVLMDMDFRFVRINERMAEINGLPVEAHIGRTLREVVPDLADFIMELYRPVYERGEPVLDVELQGPAPSGPDVQRRWLANFFPFRSKTGEVIGLIGAVVDISERVQQETRLRDSEERFRTIFETVSDAIFVQDTATGKFVDVNKRAVDMFGYGHDELLAMTIAGLSEDRPPFTAAEASGRIEQALAGQRQTFEWRCRRRDGSTLWVEIACRPATFGGADYLLSTMHNIDERKAAEERLMQMARFDLLTGLANRGVFVSDLDHAIAAVKRRGSGLAVLFLDLDHFKDVNDTLGHPIGDQLLQSVARRLRENLRGADILARFGGDEFAVLMADLQGPADVEPIAQRVAEAMEQ